MRRAAAGGPWCDGRNVSDLNVERRAHARHLRVRPSPKGSAMTDYVVMFPADNEDEREAGTDADHQATFDTDYEFGQLLEARGGAVTGGAGLTHSSKARTIKRGPNSTPWSPTAPSRSLSSSCPASSSSPATTTRRSSTPPRSSPEPTPSWRSAPSRSPTWVLRGRCGEGGQRRLVVSAVEGGEREFATVEIAALTVRVALGLWWFSRTSRFRARTSRLDHREASHGDKGQASPDLPERQIPAPRQLTGGRGRASTSTIAPPARGCTGQRHESASQSDDARG